MILNRKSINPTEDHEQPGGGRGRGGARGARGGQEALFISGAQKKSLYKLLLISLAQKKSLYKLLFMI